MTPAVRGLLLGAAALLTLAGGAAWVCPGNRCAVPALDAAGLGAAHESRAAWLDGLVQGVTWAGSLWLLLPLAILVAWRLSRCDGWQAASFVPAALLTATALAHLAKLAVLRPRPELFPPLVAMPADASFPSAHAMQVSALVLALLLRPGAQPGIAFWLAGVALIVLVAASRVYLQLHFPSDVLAGIAAAVTLVLALRTLPCWRGAQP